MRQGTDNSRRRLLKIITVGSAVISIAEIPAGGATAADLPLVAADDPAAKALKYVSDASKAPDAKPGSTCANCSLYEGAAGSDRGACTLFPGKAVSATGWCSSWNQM